MSPGVAVRETHAIDESSISRSGTASLEVRQVDLDADAGGRRYDRDGSQKRLGPTAPVVNDSVRVVFGRMGNEPVQGGIVKRRVEQEFGTGSCSWRLSSVIARS